MFIPDNLLQLPTKNIHAGNRIRLKPLLPLTGQWGHIPNDMARVLVLLKGMRHGDEALAYAHGVEQDPAKMAFYSSYEKRLQSPFRLALNDFMNPPVIHQVDTDEYSGRPGDGIYLKITDDFRVTRVVVSISTAKGQLVEQGESILLEGAQWVYRATVPHADWHKSVLRVAASDYSGNCTVQNNILITKSNADGKSK